MTEPARPLGIVETPADDVTAPPRSSLLDALRDDLARETDDDFVLLTVPARPAYTVRYSAKVSYEQFGSWAKRSEDKSKPNGMNLLRFGAIVLANCCRGILRDGEEILTDGQPLTFTSKALHELLGVDDNVQAVKAFYGNDAHVITSGTEVISEAGYGDQISQVDADPTRR